MSFDFMTAFHGLDNTLDATARLKAIDIIREHVRSHNGCLLIPDLPGLFSRIHSRLLNDSSNSVIFAIIQLLIDLSPEFGKSPDVDSEVSALIPAIIANLGHQKSPIRKVSLTFLQKFIQHSHNQSVVIGDMIKYGLHCDEWKVRKETVDALVTLIDNGNISDVDQPQLISALIGRLRDVSDSVVRAAVICLGHLQAIIGEMDVIQQIVATLPPILRQLYDRYRGRIQQAIDEQLIVGATALHHSKPDFDGPTITVDSNPNLASPTGDDLSPAAFIDNNQQSFGFVPESLMEQLKDKQDWKNRAMAIEELQKLVGDLDAIPPTVLKYHFVDLVEFLVELLEDPNYKINLVTLHITDDLVLKCTSKSGLKRIISVLVPALITRLADTKTIIRQSSMSIIHNLMRTLGPKIILDQSLPLLQTTESHRVKQEVLNLIISAVISFPTIKFDVDGLVAEIWPRLTDDKTRVRYIAMETCAVLADYASADRILQLIGDKSMDNELMAMLRLRFQNPNLPKLSQEGLVEHLVTRVSSSTTHRFPAPAATANHPMSDNQAFRRTTQSANLASGGMMQSRQPAATSHSAMDAESKLVNALNVKSKQPLTVGTAKNYSQRSAGARSTADSKSIFPKLDARSSIVDQQPHISQNSESQLQKQSSYEMMEQLAQAVKSAPLTRRDTGGSEGKPPPIIRRTTSSSTSSNPGSQQPVSLQKRTSVVKPAVAVMTEIKLSGTPESDFRKATNQLKVASEWEHKVQALDTLVALMSQAVENGDATTISLLTSNLRDLSVAFVAESQNLRTQVCRSAVAAIGQLYRVVGKAICTGGPDLDSTVSALLRKYGEGSSGRENFMTEEIDQALDTVCRIQGGWSPTRVMNALISTGADHKNALVRAKVSACLSMIICNPDNSEVIASRLLSNPKDFEKPMLALTKFLGEGLQETRASAKVALLEMDAKTGDLIAVVERILPSKEVNTIREMIQSNVSAGRRSTVAIKLDDQQAGGLARRKTMTKQHRGKAQHGSSKESLSNKASNNDLQQHELEHLDELLRQLAEPDWKRRYESISSIGNLISTFPEAFNSTRVVKLFDIFIDRLKDSNTKVNLYALQSLNEWTKPLKNSMESVIINTIPAVASNLGSAASSARQAASDVLDTFNRELSDKSLMLQLQTMSNNLQFGGSSVNNATNNPKVKAMIVEKMIAGFKRAADSQNMGAYSSVTSLNGSGSSHANPSIIINRLLAKTAIPVINKLLQSSDSVKSLELKGQLRQLAQFCRSQMGPGAFEGSFANKQTADKVCSMLSLG